MSGRFLRAVAGEPMAVPPIWMMRQAGRYQARYQALRAAHSFEDLCRVPELSAAVALGPILDFDFDAAILFSDLLFPLEALGFGLSYADGPPKLDRSLTAAHLAQLRSIDEAAERMTFQREAMAATRDRLPRDKGLIGFVGGPWTLFVYAVEGTHAGALARAKSEPDLYRAFADLMVPLLERVIALQFAGGADLVMVFDTAAGEIKPGIFSGVAPDLARLAGAFPGRLGYYAKGFTDKHLAAAGWPESAPWAGLGFDWDWDLAARLTAPDRAGFVQGNFAPSQLLETGPALEAQIDAFTAPLRRLDPQARRGWICGLGHGVLPATPEASVRTFVDRVRDTFV